MIKIFFAALLFIPFCSLSSASDQFSSRDLRYQLRPGDSIRVSYRMTPEYDATVDIQPDGYATLPLVQDVKLGGLTLPEIRAKVLASASTRLNEPEITVELKVSEQPYYIVGGEVGTPGRFPIRGHITALRAIEMAGGFKTSGKSSQVLLIRPINNVDGQTIVLNLKRVINERHLNEDVEIRSGDMLIVPKTRLAKVEPYVKLVNAGFYLNPLGF